MSEKTIIDRLTNLEAKLDRLAELKKPSMSDDKLREFINRVEVSYDNMGIVPLLLVINEKFADDLKHKAVYYDDERGCWILIRETFESTIPIVFKDISRDWIVESVTGGYFS